VESSVSSDQSDSSSGFDDSKQASDCELILSILKNEILKKKPTNDQYSYSRKKESRIKKAKQEKVNGIQVIKNPEIRDYLKNYFTNS
jgi:hypothetical protein